jgi:hypothetical protein
MRTLEAGGSHLLAALVKGERTLSELSWHFALLLPRAVAVDIVALRSPMRHYSIGEKALEALQYSAEVRMEVRTLLEWRRQAFDTLAAVHDRQRDLLRSHLEDRFEDISGDVYEDGFEDDPKDDHEGAGGAAVLLSGASAGAVADAAALAAKADRWGDDAVRLRVRIGAAEEKVLASVLKKRPGLSFSRRTGKAMAAAAAAGGGGRGGYSAEWYLRIVPGAAALHRVLHREVMLQQLRSVRVVSSVEGGLEVRGGGVYGVCVCVCVCMVCGARRGVFPPLFLSST